jgi:hypothetical protein
MLVVASKDLFGKEGLTLWKHSWTAFGNSVIGLSKCRTPLLDNPNEG